MAKDNKKEYSKSSYKLKKNEKLVKKIKQSSKSKNLITTTKKQKGSNGLFQNTQIPYNNIIQQQRPNNMYQRFTQYRPNFQALSQYKPKINLQKLKPSSETVKRVLDTALLATMIVGRT